MTLDDAQCRYLAGRESLVRRWPAVGAILLVAIAAVVLYLFVFSPLLVNPWYTARLLEAGSVPQHTMAEMSAKLPVVFLVCCGLLVAMVLVQFAVMMTERRLLGLVKELVREVDASRMDRSDNGERADRA
jgi:hypothetical protein